MLERSELFDYYDGQKSRAVAWVRLYRCQSWCVVLATDRSSTYECRSVTNSIEELATAAVARYILTPERCIWIEHYDYEPRVIRKWLRSENFSIVSFDAYDYDFNRFRKPHWTHVTREIAQQWTGEEIVAETESGVTR